MNTEKNLNIFMQFLGYGCPKSKIWFIGLEEGGDSISKDNLKKKLKEYLRFPFYIEPEDVKSTKTQVWDYISKFLLEYLKMRDIDWRSYREIMFTKSHSKFFLTELFPLPKKRFKDWSKEYIELFGFRFHDRNEYIQEVHENRFPLIYNLWKHENRSLTICFGKSGWKDYKKLLHLDCVEFYKNCEIDKSKKVVLIPFLGYHWVSNLFIKNLAEELKSV